jgi:hypothetical protein
MALAICVTSGQCRKVLRYLNITSKYELRYLKGQIHNFLRQVPPPLQPHDSGGSIGRIRSFPLSISFHRGYTYVSGTSITGPLVAADRRRGLTPRHNQSINQSSLLVGCWSRSVTFPREMRRVYKILVRQPRKEETTRKT